MNAPANLPKLFLSYRRHDSADTTERLGDQLKAHFGQESVFIDIDGIPIGADFRKHLENAVSQCDVFLAVIGKNWLDAAYDDGPQKGNRRLDDPDDWVRIEIESALNRGIPVVPVLIGGTPMPGKTDLPDGLQELAYRHAATVRSGQDFHSHAERLIRGLEKLLVNKRELTEGAGKAIRLANEDPEMALIRARKVLERVIRDVYEWRINEPPGNRSLEKLAERLDEDGYLPDQFDVLALVHKFDNIGSKSLGERITPAEAQQALADMMAVLKWYLEIEQPDALGANRGQKSRTGKPIAVSPEAKMAVVPKGLRSFDANDADFFLGLLPGPRDKDGLPESIRFWKHRIEARDEPAFTVGVIYGPSGCGKSSLMKAGLLPRLASHVLSVYVEATADDTEARLLKGLRKRCPDLPGDLGLTGTIAALRQGQNLSQGQKVFIVLDQFEQWLHAKRGKEATELVQALRQCDGEHVQCIVLVRDDFWLAVSRFMGDLQIEVLQGQNIALVDLFDLIHARNVLAAFGRAFGRLNEELTGDQEAFLDQAVSGLAQEGKVVCVRLALFADMMKGKPWTPATLKEVGGTEGVGVTFLEETFSAETAPPEHRYHQKAARAILKELLPETGTDIKGHIRSYAELLDASGYANRPKDFDGLIRILDSEICLITPTDPEGKDGAEDSAPRVQPGQKYYQLTHDYLVPSLRDWLTRKQKETRRGRAELRLADHAVVWNVRPENRQLPSLLQWMNIRWFTQKKDWTPPQRKMMRKAGRYHAVRGMALAAFLFALTFVALAIRDRVVEHNQATRAAGLVQRLLDAETAQVPDIIDQLKEFRNWADPLLKEEYDKERQDSRRKLHASLALLRTDNNYLEVVFLRFLEASPQEIWFLHKELLPHQVELHERLWQTVEGPPKDHDQQRLCAACCLACFPSAKEDNWPKFSKAIVEDVLASVQKNPSNYPVFLKMLQPVSEHLLAPLSSIFRSKERTDSKRTFVTSLLAEYATDRPDVLADLLTFADEKEFAVLFPKIEGRVEKTFLPFHEIVKLSLDSQNSQGDKERLAKRQVNAGVALFLLGKTDLVWPLLKHSPDPRVRSYLIHRLGPLVVKARRTIVIRLDDEPNVTIRRALILSLGEFGNEELSWDERKMVVTKLQDIYCSSDDAGLHAAAEWLLRTWEQGDWLKQKNEEWAMGQDQREKTIRQKLAKEKQKTPPQWYVNGQGQTMVVIPGPVEFMMGSPPAEAFRYDSETQHSKRISRCFAIAAKSVTAEQYRQFDKGHPSATRMADLPVFRISWYQAAAYCNWLSGQEGIPSQQWCYETENGNVTKLKIKYLSLTGYRLPTEAEWEYACRAGAVTSRYYGETEELLEKYAWYLSNSRDLPWPVGSLKPNDFGLFDMYGNSFNWCQEGWNSYRTGNGEEAIEDQEDGLLIGSTSRRVLRGGGFTAHPLFLRSAFRGDGDVPTWRDGNYGFRVARTFVP